MKLEALFPYILPDVPGAPDVTVKQALINSAIEFCTLTHVWDEIQDPLPLVDGQADYDVDSPNGGRVLTVKNVWALNRELRPVTMNELVQLIPNWQEATGSMPAYYNTPGDLGSITVYPIPVGANGATITIRAVYTPSLNAVLLPDPLINRYLEPLMSGAKARLMLTPGKGWSNPQLGAYHQQQFDDGVLKAKIDVLHDKTQGSLRVKPLRFGF